MTVCKPEIVYLCQVELFDHLTVYLYLTEISETI